MRSNENDIPTAEILVTPYRDELLAGLRRLGPVVETELVAIGPPMRWQHYNLALLAILATVAMSVAASLFGVFPAPPLRAQAEPTPASALTLKPTATGHGSSDTPAISPSTLPIAYVLRHKTPTSETQETTTSPKPTDNPVANASPVASANPTVDATLSSAPALPTSATAPAPNASGIAPEPIDVASQSPTAPSSAPAAADTSSAAPSTP